MDRGVLEREQLVIGELELTAVSPAGPSAGLPAAPVTGPAHGPAAGVGPRSEPGSRSRSWLRGAVGRRRGRRHWSVPAIWALTVVLAAAAGAIYAGPARHLHPPGGHIPMIGIGLVAVFAAAEIFVVHVKFYRETQTFSLSEVGLVVGLFFATPAQLVLAYLVGGGLALVVHRRQQAVKLAFNLASFALSTLSAVVVFHALGAGGDPLGGGWFPTFGAVFTFTVVGVLAVFSAIALSDGSSSQVSPISNLIFGVVSAFVTGSLGLIAVAIMRLHPLGVLLIILPTAGLYLANREYMQEREKNVSLRFLYDSTRLLNQSPELTSAIGSMLAQARETVGADIALLTYLPNDGSRLVQSCVGPGEVAHLMREVEQSTLAPLWDRLADGWASFNFDSQPGGDSEVVAGLVAGTDLVDGWVIPLRGESRIIGVLAVANHLRAVGGFTAADVRMLETLAGHLSVALENGRLEQSLAELRLLQAQLTFEATHDSLTRLPNRSLFWETTTAALSALHTDPGPGTSGSGGSEGRSMAVLFVDLDDFKTVNDSLGHAAGDELLVVVAQRISACLRVGDFAARLGGDEFAVLVPDMADAGSAIRVAERIIDSLSTPVSLRAGQVRVNASIGLAIGGTPSAPMGHLLGASAPAGLAPAGVAPAGVAPAGVAPAGVAPAGLAPASSPATGLPAAWPGRLVCDTAESLMRNADMAMYRAKSAGKARWAVFSPDMHEAVVRRQDLTQDLLTGIAAGQLEVHLQPMVDLRTGTLLGAEALVRWNHPRFGLLSPDVFIPVAEESGHISGLTRYVLAEACRQAVGWSDPAGAPWLGFVSVNLSARDFDDGNLVAMVSDALEQSGLRAERLMLEITETLMLNDPVSSTVQLQGLADLGVHIALDDFGTGYSSLSQLGHLPLGWVKVAKPFVDALGLEPRGEALVRAIVDIGAALDVRVVAEGIETPEQLRLLQKFGCDVGQGYHIGRPLPAASWLTWLDGRLRTTPALTDLDGPGADRGRGGTGAGPADDRPARDGAGMPAGAGTMARAAAGVGRLAEAIDLSVVREARGSASREHRWSPGAVDQSAG